MTQESPAANPPGQDVHAQLQAISEMLRRPHRLDAPAQGALADFVEALDRALQPGTMPTDETARLATTAAHFADAIHREEEAGVIRTARERLEEAVVAAENSAPMLAGLARRFVETLANIGI